MKRITARGLGPPLPVAPPADATDPSPLEVTDPDGPSFEVEDEDPHETSDALAAFEQRRRIYPQAAASSSSDGSVAAAYHTVHDVPRGHHDTLPTGPSAAPVVVEITADGTTDPPRMPLPEPAAGGARDVSTFPLPRARSHRSVMLVAIAAFAGVTALVALLAARGGDDAAAPGAADHAAATGIAAAPVAPLVAAPPPTGIRSMTLLVDAAASPAPSPAQSSAPTDVHPTPPITSAPSLPRPSAPPRSSPPNAAPATARPAGDFDDLVRETKP